MEGGGWAAAVRILGWVGWNEVASVRENDTLTAAGYFDVPRHDGGVA